MRIASSISTSVFSLIFLGSSLSSGHAYIGKSISYAHNDIAEGIVKLDGNVKDGVHTQTLTWCGNPNPELKNRAQLSKLGGGLWVIEFSAYKNIEKNQYIIYNVSFTKLQAQLGQPKIITDIQRAIIIHHVRAIGIAHEFANLKNKVVPQNQAEKITINSKVENKELIDYQNKFKRFKDAYLCIGQTIEQLETRFGKGKKVNNPAHPHIERHFEKFDQVLKENWKIEVVLWKNPNDPEPVVQQVYYKRKTPFTSQELEWQRYINAEGKSWVKDGMDAFFIKFKTTCGELLAGVRKLQQEAVIQTQGYKSNLPFHAFIGENFDVLRERIEKRHLPNKFKVKTLLRNPIENFLFLDKYVVENLKNPQEPGVHWQIEVIVWRDDNKIHEVSYTKAGKHISPHEVGQIKKMNNGQLIKEPILIKPNDIRPQKLTFTSKQLLTLLDDKKKQLVQFKESYLCIGQTIEQLETRFGKGKKVNNPAHPHIERHFEKFDQVLKENWKIEVVLWKNLNDPEPVVHQVYYKRKTPFTSHELEWQRHINAEGKSWVKDGMDAFFKKFKTKCGKLLAGVRKLQQEAVIHTQGLQLQKQ